MIDIPLFAYIDRHKSELFEMRYRFVVMPESLLIEVAEAESAGQPFPFEFPDLPNDSKLIGQYYDRCSACGYWFFHHPSFELVPLGKAPIPLEVRRVEASKEVAIAPAS